jgi:hypothetical protein
MRDCFVREKVLKLEEEECSPLPITLIVDGECRKKLRQKKLQAAELRSIQGFFCCKHVAYAKFTCNHKVFFYDSQDADHRSYIPFKCPLSDGGRVYKDSQNEISA